MASADLSTQIVLSASSIVIASIIADLTTNEVVVDNPIDPRYLEANVGRTWIEADARSFDSFENDRLFTKVENVRGYDA